MSFCILPIRWILLFQILFEPQGIFGLNYEVKSSFYPSKQNLKEKDHKPWIYSESDWEKTDPYLKLAHYVKYLLTLPANETIKGFPNPFAYNTQINQLNFALKRTNLLGNKLKTDKSKRLTNQKFLKIVEDSLQTIEKLQRNDLKIILPIYDSDAIIKKDQGLLNQTLISSLLTKFGYVNALVTQKVKNQLRLDGNRKTLKNVLSNLTWDGTSLQQICPYHYIKKYRECETKAKYREIDGYCNNVKNPLYGATGTPVQRFIPSDYGDGISDLRKSKSGQTLPNPRVVSTSILETKVDDHPELTHVLMTFGQIMDHEFALGSSPTGFEMGDVKCCDLERIAKKPVQHYQCLAIDIPKTDKFYSKFNSTCMEFVRSIPAVDLDCKIGQKETINEITSFIDGSFLYGSTVEVANRLRDHVGGLLKTQVNPLNRRMQRLMPLSPKPTSEACANIVGKFRCFGAGDKRANENSLLSSMHTIWVREHNRIAEKLAGIHLDWNDETLYQEARRIIIAMIQHITYNEFLPIVLGPQVMAENELLLNKQGYYNGYDSNVNAAVDQGFITAAFRFGHSLINKDMFKMKNMRSPHTILQLKKDFFHPQHVYRMAEEQILNYEATNGSNVKEPKIILRPKVMPDGGIDELIIGVINQPAQKMDSNIADDVKNHLFRLDHEKFGMDLMVLNIMRAREHGVPGFNAWRKWCNLKDYKSWKDVTTEDFPPTVIEAMKSVYEHPYDMDIFPAGVSEKAKNGSLLGPVFTCILARQFNKFRKGDRYWYENPGCCQPNPFPLEQLGEIRKMTLAKVLCENTDNLKILQRDVFRKPSIKNQMVKCNDLPDINITLWS